MAERCILHLCRVNHLLINAFVYAGNRHLMNHRFLLLSDEVNS